MSNTEEAILFDLFYLKSRDEIIESMPENVKADKQKIQDELDFYPEKLRPFMGLTLEGKPVSWRYKGNNTDIFDIALKLKVPNRSDIPVEELSFTLKSSWFESMSPKHTKVMADMAAGGTMGVFIPEEIPSSTEPEEEYEVEETEEETEEYTGFEERCILYLKTAKDMGITEENFRSGNFTCNQYYPESLRAYAGAVLTVKIVESFEDIDSDTKRKTNHIEFIIGDSHSPITIDIPITEDRELEDLEVLLFDYKNWISMFADIIEASGPVISDLIDAMKYLESMGVKVQKTEGVTDMKEETKDIASSGDNTNIESVDTNCTEKEYNVVKPKEYGMEFLGILKGPKELGITEEEFYCKSFKNANLYPNDVMHLASGVFTAFLIDDDFGIITVDNIQYDVPSIFIMAIDSPNESSNDDPWNELSIFDKNNIGKEVIAGTVDDFMFVKYPDVSARIKAKRPDRSSAFLISLLSGFVHMARLTLSLLDKGIRSDFIILTDFVKDISAVKLPVDVLDNLMFFQIDNKMEIYVVAYEDGTQTPNGSKVDISYADNTPEDEYLMELSDEFEADMNSGSGLRRLILDQHPGASIIELRRI